MAIQGKGFTMVVLDEVTGDMVTIHGDDLSPRVDQIVQQVQRHRGSKMRGRNAAINELAFRRWKRDMATPNSVARALYRMCHGIIVTCVVGD